MCEFMGNAWMRCCTFVIASMAYGRNTLNNSLGRPEIKIIKLWETIEQLGHQGKLQCSKPRSSLHVFLIDYHP